MAWYDFALGVPYGVASSLGVVPGTKDIANTIGGLANESPSAIKRRELLNEQGAASGNLADMLTGQYGGLSQESVGARNYLRDIASGKSSVSREQLRQGLGSNLASMRSMAASASPQNSAMAARTAMMAGGRAATGMSGQAAMAGIQERQAAQAALAQMLTAQQGQAIQGANAAHGNAISAYGNVTPDKSWLEKWGPAIMGGAQLAAGA
jgi:hypothetical protein